MKLIVPLSCLGLSLSLVLFAQGEGEGEESPARKILRQLNELKSLGQEEYREKVVEITQNFNRYLSYQKKVCAGEFSSLVFEREKRGEALGERPKLSKEEREACTRSLLEMQKKYVEVSFDKRAEFLQLAHRERMERLQQQRQEALQELFPVRKSKKRSRKKR